MSLEPSYRLMEKLWCSFHTHDATWVCVWLPLQNSTKVSLFINETPLTEQDELSWASFRLSLWYCVDKNRRNTEVKMISSLKMFQVDQRMRNRWSDVTANFVLEKPTLRWDSWNQSTWRKRAQTQGENLVGDSAASGAEPPGSVDVSSHKLSDC